MGQGTADNLILLFCHKEITQLYKGFLATIEDLRTENKTMLDKVAKHCAPEFADDINYFDDAKHNQIRKRVLDNSNDTIRNISSYVDMFDSSINEEKVKLASQRKITFKVTTHSTLYENK